jgi:hypothetical protein
MTDGSRKLAFASSPDLPLLPSDLHCQLRAVQGQAGRRAATSAEHLVHGDRSLLEAVRRTEHLQLPRAHALRADGEQGL